MRSEDFPFYLVDASGFIFRAFHALPPLLNPQGIPVGAVYGFLSMMINLLHEHKPQKLGIVFDVARKTFRQDLYPAYKMNRLAPPPELVGQFALVREACQAFGLQILEQEGFEADDVLATYVAGACHTQEKITLVSSDKDLMQLVSPLTRLWDPMKRKAIHEAEVLEKFGVPPFQVIDVQALMGDSSDNVPGVPGVGLKTAQQLIQTFGSLENLYDHLDQIPQIKRRELLKEHKKEAFLSRQLVHLTPDVPLKTPSKDLTFQGITLPAARAFLEHHQFRSLLNRLSPAEVLPLSVTPNSSHPTEEHTSPLTSYTLIQDQTVLKKWIGRAIQQGWIAVDLETTSLDGLKAEIVGIALALNKGDAAYIPLTHHTNEKQLTLEETFALLRPLFEDTSVMKIGHNLKYDLLVLKKYGLSLSPLADTLLLSYVLKGGQHAHNLDFLSGHYLGHQTITYQALTGTGKTVRAFQDVPLDEALAYAAEDADMTLQLWHLFRHQILTQHLNRIYELVERPLIPVLVQVEANGICVDSSVLQTLSRSFEERLEKLAHDIYHLVGQEFNIASPKQLGTILFEHLGLPIGKKTKTGLYGTASDVLEKLAAQGHTIAKQILDWRALAKLKNTYADTLPQQINPQTGRVHTSFVMAGTTTGRLASTDPNLQNIPIRTEEGRAIRRAFVPEPGNVLASFDYSQIELRLLAHMGQVQPLIEAFQKGLDIHSETAAQVFGVPREKVDRHLRRSAKTINFGIIYGMSAFGLSERLGIPRAQAAQYIEAYFTHYAGIKSYMERMKQRARDQGYVETLWGRRCYISGIQERQPVRRQAAERQAVNAPLQGTAADLIKRAMIHIDHLLQSTQTSVRMILQIHDELLFEGREEEIQKLSPLIRDCMTRVTLLDVPLIVDQGFGKNWDEAH